MAEVYNAREASGKGDRQQVAEAFSRSNLSAQHFENLRVAAHRLDTQLKQHEAKAQVIIRRYRKEAQEAQAAGQSLPRLPQQLHVMERERTALLIDSYVRLRSELGTDEVNALDTYLSREFVPRIKLQRLTEPAEANAAPVAQ